MARETHIHAEDGTALFVRHWLPEAAPRAVVCLTHGLGEHGGRYDHVAKALTAAGVAVLVLDLRGHGRSEGKRGHIASYDLALDDVGLLLEQADQDYPKAPRFLYGHSLGGNIVLNYILRRRPPILGAVATSPLLEVGFAPPAWKLTIGRLAYALVPSLCMGNEVNAAGLTAEREVVSAYVADPLVHDRVSARLAIDMLEAGRWALGHAAELATPLLLMAGDDDTIVSPRASAAFARAAGPLCTFRSWPGLKHELHNEARWLEVMAVIVSWLDERLAAAARP